MVLGALEGSRTGSGADAADVATYCSISYGSYPFQVTLLRWQSMIKLGLNCKKYEFNNEGVQ